MLKHLTINNYVLIEALDIDLQAGFSVMTGETGAGKSIILGALGLLMGQRADTGSIMPGAAKCTVEGIFGIEGYDLQALFEENELDYEPTECILRREVAANGKSRAFVNDSPVSVAVLRQIALRLLDIHSQHSNLLLENPAFQLSIVDIVAGHQDLLEQYKECFARIVEAKRQLKELEESLAKRQSDEDYLRFQLDQLDEFKPQAGEDEELKQLQSALSHAEDIKVALSTIDALLNGNDSEGGVGAIDALRRSSQTMQQISKVFPAIEDYMNRLESVVIEVKDIAADINALAEDIEYNPSRLQQVTERLDNLFAFEQKHHLSSSEELLALAEDIRTQLDSLTSSEDDIQALRQQIAKDTEQANKLAAKLSSGRTKAAKQVEKLVCEAIVAMDMPAARFSVNVEKHAELLPTGMDDVSFLFSANKSMAARPLADIASGGEMSRVMLALKALTSKQTHLPTIIFDEIDTGVSGRVASSMAQIMSQMSSGAGQQVLAITHLPQIAAKGDTHYFVYKEEEDGRTLTHIRKLDEDGRVTELAHLLSGTTVTEAAKENARQLLSEKVKNEA
ncbi:MAG: DNA repair protein RecN [Bacteroidaceae bacterium]|nr:DNA repair protein RecN [Bacteroidaceae bacterium]